MAHIAIDARKYFDFGIGTYIQCLAGALSKLSTAHTFSLYVAPHDAARIVPPDGWKMRSVPYGKYSVSEFMLFGFRVRRDGVQLFHEPHYTLPAGLKGRSVVTIQDLAQLRLPQYFTPLQRAYAHFMIQHALRHAGAVLTTSQFTRHDIMDKFGLDASRVIVVPLGIRDVFQPISDTQRLDRFRVRNGLEKPYILYVGNMKAHKNIPLILRSFKRLLLNESNIDLVFAGEPLLRGEQLRREATDLDLLNHIHDLGRLTMNDLVSAYAGAEMFVLPSEFEGFGLPVLEAMACGTPVIISDAAALPEVAGGAAFIVARGNEDALSHAMHRLLTDSLLRNELKDRGRQNVCRFSWDRTAQQTLDVYNRLV